MSEQNEAVAEVPEEGNSAVFFTEQPEGSVAEGKKTSWPWAAVVAAAIVAGVGGYAFGQTDGFGTRPAASHERFGDMDGQQNDQMGPMGTDGQMPNGHMPNPQMGPKSQLPSDQAPNGLMGPMGGHHGPGMDHDDHDDDDDDDDDRGEDPDGDNWTGTNRQPTPTASQ